MAMDDATLKQFLGEGTAPASDPDFAIAVMARIERRQFHRALWRSFGIGAACAMLLALAAPALNMVVGLLAVPASNEVAQFFAGPLANGWILAGLLLAGAALIWRPSLQV